MILNPGTNVFFLNHSTLLRSSQTNLKTGRVSTIQFLQDLHINFTELTNTVLAEQNQPRLYLNARCSGNVFGAVSETV